jgi:hypothetical protein
VGVAVCLLQVDLAHWLPVLARVDRILCDCVQKVPRLGAEDVQCDANSGQLLKCLRFLVRLLKNAPEKRLFNSFHVRDIR